MSPGKLTVILALAVIVGAEEISREKRSPHKKHKIIIVNEGQQAEIDGGGGWGGPPPPPPSNQGGWGAPLPPPPSNGGGWGAPAPPPAQRETIVEHHHHYEVAPAPTPPHSQSHSVSIEINKGGKGKLEQDLNKFREFKEGVDTAIEQIDNDKKAKLDAFKEDVDEKLEALSQIPHLIASDIDFFGRKIAEDIEHKKKKHGSVSIQINKGKGNSGSVSGETVHHHHYYHDNVEQGPPPPPPPPPQTLPPPRPPTKQYGWGSGQASAGGDGLEHLFKFVDAGAHFMDFLGTGGGGGSQYNRRPAYDAGSAGYESGGGWGQGQGQGQRGKGFRVSISKSVGFRRRK